LDLHRSFLSYVKLAKQSNRKCTNYSSTLSIVRKSSLSGDWVSKTKSTTLSYFRARSQARRSSWLTEARSTNKRSKFESWSDLFSLGSNQHLHTLSWLARQVLLLWRLVRNYSTWRLRASNSKRSGVRWRRLKCLTGRQWSSVTHTV
jgi:hypothetical protein